MVLPADLLTHRQMPRGEDGGHGPGPFTIRIAGAVSRCRNPAAPPPGSAATSDLAKGRSIQPS